MTQIDSDIAMMLGEFRAQISALTDAVRSNTEEAKQERAAYLEEMRMVRERQSEDRLAIRGLTARIEAMEEITGFTERWRERMNGVWMAVTMIGMTLGGAVTLFWQWISKKIGF